MKVAQKSMLSSKMSFLILLVGFFVSTVTSDCVPGKPSKDFKESDLLGNLFRMASSIGDHGHPLANCESQYTTKNGDVWTITGSGLNELGEKKDNWTLSGKMETPGVLTMDDPNLGTFELTVIGVKHDSYMIAHSCNMPKKNTPNAWVHYKHQDINLEELPEKDDIIQILKENGVAWSDLTIQDPSKCK